LRGQYPGAQISSVVLDRETFTAEYLHALSVFIVIDAAGPFQGQASHLARMAIAAKCHFIDIADARDYVAKFPELDAAARAAGVLAVAGAKLASLISGHDLVISAFNPGKDKTGKGTASIIEAAKKSGVARLLIVGGAGTLEVAPGKRVIDQPEFPAALRETSLRLQPFWTHFARRRS
jgi:short subunit dehydrogenase-like uncharacterized protein